MPRGSTVRFRASDLFARCTYRNLRYGREKGGIILHDAVVVEDDAPGTPLPEPAVLSAPGDVAAKDLFVEDAACFLAWLLVYRHVDARSRGGGCMARIEVNGNAVEADLVPGWSYVEMDPDWLRNGKNEVRIAPMAGSAPLGIPVAGRGSIIENRAERFNVPQRSRLSTDAGATWRQELTAEGGHGELLVRFHLSQFVKSGVYESAVFDLADVLDRETVKQPVALDAFTAEVDAAIPPGTGITFYYRTGSVPEYVPERWRDWRICRSGERCEVDGRYFQGKMIFETASPRATPVVKSISFGLGLKRLKGPGADRIRVETCDAPEYRVTSVPFRYENLAQRYLKKLRDRFMLDGIVDGAASEFERMTRLLHWTAARPECLLEGGRDEWNALEILERGGDRGSAPDFDRQFAVVLMQACLAYGIQARYTGGSLSRLIPGHAVVEAWSNDYRRWVVLDPVQDRYYVREGSLEPLNNLDMQSLLLEYFAGPSNLKTFENDRRAGGGGRIAGHYRKAGVLIKESDRVREQGVLVDPADLSAGGGLYLLPRNNLLSEKYPIPRLDGGSWDGWVHWDDDKMPWELQTTGYVRRLSDWYWPLNGTSLTLEAAGAPGLLTVYCRSVCPGFTGFFASFNGKKAGEVPARFDWPLQEGPNVLEVRTRNVLDTDGPVSRVKISFSPA